MFANKRITIRKSPNIDLTRKNDLSSLFVRSYERKWGEFEQLFDYVHQTDRNAATKRLQRDLYWHAIKPFLKDPANANLLDVGCGVGRFTVFAAEQGYRVTGVDASERALNAAAGNLNHAGIEPGNVALWHADSHNMAFLTDHAFDVALALELVCYHTDPLPTLTELYRVTKPGGLVAVSVESLLGSILADPKLETAHIQFALANHEIHVPGEFFVRYYDPETLAGLLVNAGLECIKIVGTHYILDGPFSRLCAGLDLWDHAIGEQILTTEQFLAENKTSQHLARAWLAIARKPA